MSTLNVNRIVDASGGVFAPASSVFKNRIINGQMTIDQRNAGASVTLNDSGIYTVDRWQGYEDSDGVMTAQQDSSAPAGFVNSLKLTTTTADTSLSAGQLVQLTQRIEGFNVADLNWGTANAKTVTLSFWTRSSLTGSFGGAVQNSANNRSYPFTYSISAADTWEYKTVTITGDTSGTWLTTNGTGLQIRFSMGAGSDFQGTAGAWAGSDRRTVTGAVSVIGTLSATWFLTGCQLEVGTQATSFEYRQYQQELALCQRYCYVLRGNTTSNSTIGSGYWNSATASVVVFQPKTSMRATPTLIFSSTSDISALQVGINWNAVSAIALASEANADFAQIQATSTGGTSADASNIRISNSTSAYIGLTAEL